MPQTSIQQISHLNNNIAIVGAGASSLFASIILAKKGFSVDVYEKNAKAGRKILATGNGRCNISNKDLSLKNFFSSNKNFYKYAINNFNFFQFEKFCEEIGLNIIVDDNSKAYPMSLQASSVVDIFYNEALLNGVKFHFNCEIEDISYKDNIFILKSNKKEFLANKVIIASGSAAMKKLGSSDSGYKFAKKFGHNIIAPFATLVQLTSDEKDIYSLSGVKQKSIVKLYIDKVLIDTQKGDILFTKYGVSGNTILNISRDATIGLKQSQDVYIVVDLFPSFDKNKLLSILEKKKKNLSKRAKEFLLISFINKKIIPFIFKRSKIEDNKTFIEQLNKKDLTKIVYNLKNLKITISGSLGFEYAEAVAGGVDTKEIDNKTMESKLQSGLYFCGEVMDVDGACGGYNLHWAWASAYALANNLK